MLIRYSVTFCSRTYPQVLIIFNLVEDRAPDCALIRSLGWRSILVCQDSRVICEP